MKDPNSASGAGAFRVTSTATFASPVDATSGLSPATPSEHGFRWCTLTNAVQPLKLRRGCIAHD